MNPLHTHFPPRLEGDAIDVAPLLEQGLRQAPGRVVFVFEGQAVTCGELRERIDRLRAWLAGRGLRQGDRVAVMLSNSAGHIALIYALILSGLVCSRQHALARRRPAIPAAACASSPAGGRG